MAARPHRVAPLTTLAQEHTPLGSQERVSIEPGDASRSATSPKGLTFGTTPRCVPLLPRRAPAAV